MAFRTMTRSTSTFIVKRSFPVAVLPEQETPEEPLFLSSLDEMAKAVILCVYSYDRSDANVINVIKHALAKVLVHYYPLAGRLGKNSQGKLFVNCQKKLGVPFIEAVANCHIKNLGDTRIFDSDVISKLIYKDPMEEVLEVAPLLTAQVTKFIGGGFTLGIAVDHCMADGVSIGDFMNTWAKTARGEPLFPVPFHDRTILKSRESPQITNAYKDFVHITDVSNMTSLYEEQPFVYESFHFDAKKLASIKRMARKDQQATSSYTSFVALAAFVWRARSMALKMKLHQQSMLLIPVNFRSIIRTPLPEGYFGNTVAVPSCLCTMGELIEQPISASAQRISQAIQSVTDNYVRSRIDYLDRYPSTGFSLGTLVISSWVKLKHETKDFGWGEPRFATGDLPRETCLFMREGRGEGVRVVLGLPFSVMNDFNKLICDLDAQYTNICIEKLLCKL